MRIRNIIGIDLCKAKVVNARVTDAQHRYWASVWVDEDVLKAAGVFDYEKVLVVNITNGARFETYARSAPAGSKHFILGGGTAMLGKPGDEIGFLCFAMVTPDAAENWHPRVVMLNEDNSIRSVTDGDPQTHPA